MKQSIVIFGSSSEISKNFIKLLNEEDYVAIRYQDLLQQSLIILELKTILKILKR